MSRSSWLVAAVPALLFSQDARQIISESQSRSRSASQRYEGTLEVIDSKKKVTAKGWTYDRLGSHGTSKVVIRFTTPPEVKGVALLIVNHPDRSSDQWMWTPAIGRERRIALQDRSSRFFGTDFTFEDLEERDVDQYEYRMLGDEAVDGAACWKIESRPKKTKTSQYTSAVLWIRKDYYVPAQVDSFKGDKLARRLRYSDLQQVQNIWTARKLDMHDIGRDSHTILKLEKLQYNIPMRDDQFTLQALRRES